MEHRTTSPPGNTSWAWTLWTLCTQPWWSRYLRTFWRVWGARERYRPWGRSRCPPLAPPVPGQQQQSQAYVACSFGGEHAFTATTAIPTTITATAVASTSSDLHGGYYHTFGHTYGGYNSSYPSCTRRRRRYLRHARQRTELRLPLLQALTPQQQEQ